MRKLPKLLLLTGALCIGLMLPASASEGRSGIYDAVSLRDAVTIQPIGGTVVQTEIDGEQKTVYTGAESLSLHCAEASDGNQYVVFVLNEDASVPKQDNIVYMDQNETADFTIHPNDLHSGTYSVYLSGTDMAYKKAAQFAYYREQVTPSAQDIAFEQASVDRTYGDADFINAAVNYTMNGGAITYRSTDPSIASVEETTGKVTIHKAGQTTICASAAENNGYAKTDISYTLTVQPKKLAVKTVTLAQKIYNGETDAVVDVVTFEGLVHNETLESGVDFIAEAAYDRPDALDASPAKVTVQLNSTEKAKNYVLTNGTDFAAVGTVKRARNPFADVTDDSYYADAVMWAVQTKVTTGTDTNTFSPDNGCTRAQMVTFLWRTAGRPTAQTSDNPFADVSRQSYYYDAVLWAVENGITNGTSINTFSPDAACTRGQIVTFLWRAAGSPSAGSNGVPFADVSAEQYYSKAVQWAVENSITKGTSETTFSPDDTCTRAQGVTFLYRARVFLQ